MTEKAKELKDLRVEFARILHKALRQFEVEGCPEAFDMRTHIDQFVTKSQKYYEAREAKTAEEEARAIIRCIKDAKRVHPEWGIDDILDLLQFREETRTAMKALKGKPKEER